MRLSAATAQHLTAEVARPGYDRDGQGVGIVHFGIGAFHRAHQAWYTDLAMAAGDRDWMICGVSLRSADVADQLEPQDGLYTLTMRSGDAASTRLVGSVREVLHAPQAAGQVAERLASPACHIASFTVTEKGYARTDGAMLDMEKARLSFYPLLARGLRLRQERGLPGLTLLSCDNLASNGRVLADLLHQWLAAEEPGLVDWFLRDCRVPSTMVDRIVPRTGTEQLAGLQARIGMEDAGAVFTESFSQWVIEDSFAGPRPAWDRHGVQLVEDVGPYETAKLRMLNGAHSLLAYCGLKAGHEFVHEAVADPLLRGLAVQLLRDEALPTIAAAPGQDLAAYADQLLARFADPALRHRLAQIAMDGTQKIPQRWLDTMLALHRRGQRAPAIAAAFDAWLWHLEDGRFVDDPHGAELAQLAGSGGRGAVLARCFGGAGGAAALWSGYAEITGPLHSPA